jgi:hypothetical protein
MSERKSLVSGITGHETNAQVSMMKQFVKTGDVGTHPWAADQNPPEDTPPEAQTLKRSEERSPLHRKKSSPNMNGFEKASRVAPIGLVPVTVRLSPELAGALKRASLERQLNGVSTFTQQEIVQHLLEPWLKKEGYL